ncbi:MAG TPA: hypothetical protein VN641_02445 [Urbifossiella sp.]|nr:hypothetical protein [Urbifossiella sp.]
MPRPSTAESIHLIGIEIAVLGERFNALEGDVQASDLGQIRERLAVLESLVAELRKREEENERRRWQMNMLLFGSVFTLAVQIALLFIRR